MKLSVYVLTKNSERYLKQILEKIYSVADEIIIIDSGSTDKTEEIAISFSNVKFIYHHFNNFKEQRTFADNECRGDYIFFLDSDEIPDNDFMNGILELKAKNFGAEAYFAERHWNVLGKKIRALYPIVSPDFPIRLYKKGKISFKDSSLVHETPSGYSNSEKLPGKLKHITFENRKILCRKLDFYTDIAARDLLLKNKKVSKVKGLLSAIAAFFKWYLGKGGFKDGYTGILLGKYAFDYTWLKYQKAIKSKKNN